MSEHELLVLVCCNTCPWLMLSLIPKSCNIKHCYSGSASNECDVLPMQSASCKVGLVHIRVLCNLHTLYLQELEDILDDDQDMEDMYLGRRLGEEAVTALQQMAEMAQLHADNPRADDNEPDAHFSEV